MRCAGFRLHTGRMAAAPCDRRGSPAAAQPPIAGSQPVLARCQRASSVWRAALRQVPGVSLVTPVWALLHPLIHWEPASCRVDWACPCQRSDRTGFLQSWAAGAWHSSDQRCGVYQAVWECPASEPGFHWQGLPWRWAEAGNTKSESDNSALQALHPAETLAGRSVVCDDLHPNKHAAAPTAGC